MGVKTGGYLSVGRRESQNVTSITTAPKGFGARHTQALILFISMTVAFSMRAQLSVSMVAMTSSTLSDATHICNVTAKIVNVNNVTLNINIRETNQTSMNETNIGECTEELEDKRSKWNPYRSYKWSKATQEMILFSFFVGYTTMMLPMGVIVQKYGGKKPILVALVVNGVISILTPWVPILTGWIGVCGCRLLQGLSQAALYPSIHTMLGKWAPLCERGRLSTYIYSGSQFGTIFIFQVSGFLAGNPIFGWPSIFWLCGILSFICFGLLAWLGAASPQEHANISSEELVYIMGDGSADITSKKRPFPWKQILTSSAVWGMVASHSGSAMGYLLLLTEIPTYMSQVLQVDIKRNGLYSSMPYISMYVMLLFFGWLSDMLIVKKIMSIQNVRRAANTIGMVVSGAFLVGFGFVNNTAVAVILLVLCLGLHSGVHVGFHINHIDLAPNYAGPLMALGNMVASLMSLLVPVMVSYIIEDDVTNHRRWQMVFIIIAAIQFLTNLIFVLFVEGEVQDWNFYGDDELDVENYQLSEKKFSKFEEKKSANGIGDTYKSLPQSEKTLKM